MHETILDQVISQQDPVYVVSEKEFDINLLCFGAFVSIVRNKRVNQTALMVLILEAGDFQESFKQITEIDNLYILFKNFLIRYPILCKSKIIKNKIAELANENVREISL